MEHTQAPDFPVVTLFASHIVGADRDYLHIVKPLYEFLTVLESRLVELTVGKERAGALLVVAIEPAGVQHQDVMLFDSGALLLCCAQKIFEGDAFAPVEMFLATVAGGVDQDAAAHHAMISDGLNRALLQSTDCGLGIKAIVELVAVPGVTKRVVLRCRLRKHRDYVVGILESTGERFVAARNIRTFVVSQCMNRLGTKRMGRITLRARNRHAQHEDLALLDGAHAAQDFLAGQKVEASDLIIGAPPSPIFGGILQQFGHLDRFFGHGSTPSGIVEHGLAELLIVYEASVPHDPSPVRHAIGKLTTSDSIGQHREGSRFLKSFGSAPLP